MMENCAPSESFMHQDKREGCRRLLEDLHLTRLDLLVSKNLQEIASRIIIAHAA